MYVEGKDGDTLLVHVLLCVTLHLLFPLPGVVGVSRLYWGAVSAGTPDRLVSPTDGRFIPPAHPTIM